MPEANAIAFESSDRRQSLTETVAALNSVGERLAVRGIADPLAFDAALLGHGRTVVVCDIEGGERDLLDPQRVGSLVTTDLLVETHDFIVKGTSALLRERFRATHDVSSVTSRPRTGDDVPRELRRQSRWLTEAISERRPCETEWLWFQHRREATTR